ncbi:response regulator transcription factor [Paractinoplanes rishiriensis]|uniref:Uncharacterized protein n=1 Tax=Paractinoplanes rishiriensis TaxID=1050105 RepID=A0A919N1R2_9ACTN|nr:response regulator transcription factor [Actinoplanes rishiriensis]GIF02126.1 hypothetical protein Ari01nite_95900 [Actinoplanes rishiriensis]
MFVRVAVSDPLPVFRRGILACLPEAGFESPTREELLRWARTAERRVVLLSVQVPEDWQLMADLCREPGDVLVVALLSEPTVPAYVRALAAGAAAAVSRDATPAEVREAFEAALDGRVTLPIAVVRAMTSPGGSGETTVLDDRPAATEIEWLRHLAGGATVAQLAAHAGYSERMMFRLLRELYTRLGVGGRTEALMRARDRDWI